MFYMIVSLYSLLLGSMTYEYILSENSHGCYILILMTVMKLTESFLRKVDQSFRMVVEYILQRNLSSIHHHHFDVTKYFYL